MRVAQLAGVGHDIVVVNGNIKLAETTHGKRQTDLNLELCV
jgi:hypothetical protein